MKRKLIVYEAATPNDTPLEHQGTKREVVFSSSGSAQERCEALFRQFPGQCISFYDTTDDLPGWTDVTEDTIDVVGSAVQARRQLRIVKQGVTTISAETGPRLSAFLAEWDESRQQSSARSAHVSKVNTDIWMKVQQTASVTIASFEGSMVPTHTRQIPAFQWDKRYEGTQVDRYLPHILQNIKIDARQWQWVDVSSNKNLLTQGSAHSLGYNFRGTADVALCSRNAVRSNIYISGMRVLLEVKQAPVHDDTYQAMVILLLANILNPKFKPVVVLTDLRDSWVFFWLERQCIWHSAQDRSVAVGILEDMLQHEELNNSEIQALPREACDRLGIYRRQVFTLSACDSVDQQDTSLVDTFDCLPAAEAAIAKMQYTLDMFSQIPGVPMPERMGPRPVCPILGMYQ